MLKTPLESMMLTCSTMLGRNAAIGCSTTIGYNTAVRRSTITGCSTTLSNAANTSWPSRATASPSYSR